MTNDLLTGRAWVKWGGAATITLRLICRDGAWEWQDPGGNIVAEGETRNRALAALLAAYGGHEHALVFEAAALAPVEPKPKFTW